MKKTLQLFLVMLTMGALVSSCSDSCDDLSENIVGTWSASLLGPGTFEFQSDGTLIDEDDLLIDAEINGEILDMKTWSLNQDETILTIRASGSGNTFLEGALNVSSFDCDIITLQQLGVMVDLERQ